MKACSFTGLCVIAASGWALACGAWAAPGDEFETFEAEFGGSILSWVETTSAPAPMVLDEQIFTDISPLLDSPEAVRLPEDSAPVE